MNEFTKISEHMAEALGCTITFDDEVQTMIMSHPRTQAALARRGLANEHGQLTDMGKYVAYLLANGCKSRSWLRESLESGTHMWILGRKRDAENQASLDDYAQAGRIVQGLIPGVRRS
jgi:hypothetical protein